MNSHLHLENELLKKYKYLHQEGIPEWAVKSQSSGKLINPGIPFIGDLYATTPEKIAIYASAENLTYYEESSGNELIEFEKLLGTENSWTRHRRCFDNYKNDFFPNVHIEPISNGALLCAALFISYKMSHPSEYKNPREFITELAVANVGKYSISTVTKNEDYASDEEKLKVSIPFFQADLETLKPSILMIPYKIYEHAIVKQTISECIPNAIIIPVMQYTATTLNCHLKPRHADRIDEIEKEIAKNFPILKTWTEKIYINGLPTKNIYSYYAHVESIINNIENL